ncbi:FlhC family transcriptional regulator [Paracidovorax anthurii]
MPVRINQRMRALALARDCALLGARIRTINHLTGLRPRELLHLLFSARKPPPRGRAPDTREWYHSANLLHRTEASVVVANFARLRQLGFPAAEALIAAYRYYQSVYRPPSRISFDRAFDLAARVEGLWIASAPSFRLASCTRCGADFLDALSGSDTAACPCPFCQLMERHRRDPRLTATVAAVPPVSDEIIVHLAPILGTASHADIETPASCAPFPPDKR